MTTIYELEKQATPGPFNYHYTSAATARAENPGTDGGGSTGMIFDGSDTKFGHHVMAYMAINREPKRDNQHKADAALLAHCRNNFLRALEALKEEHQSSCIVQGYGLDPDQFLSHCETCQLIKELETVKE